MKHTHILLTLPFLLTGCLTVAPVKQREDSVTVINAQTPVPPTSNRSVYIDQDCAALARFARSVAISRDAGIAMKDAGFLTKEGQNFQMGPVIREVYSRRDITPDVGGTNSYKVCVNVGFENMQIALSEADKKHTEAEIENRKMIADSLLVKSAADRGGQPARPAVNKLNTNRPVIKR
jgi:hypothetical protein